MTATRVLLISDTHLSRARPYAVPNFAAVIAHVAATEPDLVVNTGDIVLDDPDDLDDHRYAYGLHTRLTSPWRVVPGNHDVGDGPPEPWQDQPVDGDRLARFREIWGDDRWSLDVGAWRLIGLDSQLFASALTDEDDAQRAWLRERLAEARGRPTGVFLHKPLLIRDRAEGEHGSSTVPDEARTEVLELLDLGDVRFVASGHLHQHRSHHVDGRVHVWAPTTAFLRGPGSTSPLGGTRRSGVVELELREDGFSWQTIRPDGLVDVDIDQLRAGYESLRFVPPSPIDEP